MLFWTQLAMTAPDLESVRAQLPPAVVEQAGDGFLVSVFTDEPAVAFKALQVGPGQAFWSLGLAADGRVVGLVASWRPEKLGPWRRHSAPNFAKAAASRKVMACVQRAEGASGAIALKPAERGPKKGQKIRRRPLVIAHQDHLASLALALQAMPRPWILPGEPASILPTISELDSLGF